MKVQSLLRKKLRNAGFLLAFMLLSTISVAQIDSVSVSISFSQDSVQMDSTTQLVDVMNVDVTINDIDFLGEVIVTVYDQATNFPLAKIKKTKAELDAENEITGNVAHLYVDFMPPTVGNYNIVTNIRNYQGADFPAVTTTY